MPYDQQMDMDRFMRQIQGQPNGVAMLPQRPDQPAAVVEGQQMRQPRFSQTQARVGGNVVDSPSMAQLAQQVFEQNRQNEQGYSSAMQARQNPYMRRQDLMSRGGLTSAEGRELMSMPQPDVGQAIQAGNIANVSLNDLNDWIRMGNGQGVAPWQGRDTRMQALSILAGPQGLTAARNMNLGTQGTLMQQQALYGPGGIAQQQATTGRMAVESEVERQTRQEQNRIYESLLSGLLGRGLSYPAAVAELSRQGVQGGPRLTGIPNGAAPAPSGAASPSGAAPAPQAGAQTINPAITAAMSGLQSTPYGHRVSGIPDAYNPSVLNSPQQRGALAHFVNNLPPGVDPQQVLETMNRTFNPDALNEVYGQTYYSPIPDWFRSQESLNQQSARNRMASWRGDDILRAGPLGSLLPALHSYGQR